MQGKTAFFYQTWQNNHQFYDLGMRKTPQKSTFESLVSILALFDNPDLELQGLQTDTNTPLLQ